MRLALSKVEIEILQEIGARLVIERHERELTQTQFGKKIGVTLRTYQTYEQGERQMPILVLRRLADEFEVDLNYLVKGNRIELNTAKMRSFMNDLDYYCEKHGYKLNNAKKSAIFSKATSMILKNQEITENDLITWVDLVREL